MTYKYRFTLFTPCYNAAGFIHRVFNSIDKFTFRNFEYIIINDCSTDNTSDVIKEYISKVEYPVKFLDRTQNAGLNENIKYALANAEGEFFVSLDHDDEWMPETLETFDALLKKYDNDKIAGIGCLCKTQYGDLVGYEFAQDELITNSFNVFTEKGKNRVEVPINYKTVIYKKYVMEYPQLLNKDLMIGCDYDVIFINKILRTYYVNENPTRLTARKRREMAEELYVNGVYYINRFQYKIKGHFKTKVIRKLKFVYHGCLANKGLVNMVHDVKRYRHKLFVVIAYLPAFVLSKIFS